MDGRGMGHRALIQAMGTEVKEPQKDRQAEGGIIRDLQGIVPKFREESKRTWDEARHCWEEAKIGRE